MRPFILLVEDDPAQRLLYTAWLKPLAYPIQTAENGLQALQILLAARPALLLLDKNMPQMGGLELLRRIRTAKQWQDVRVILFTVSPEDIPEADRALADAIVAKPTTSATLKHVVQEALVGLG